MDTHFRCAQGAANEISQQCTYVMQCHKQPAHVQADTPLRYSCLSKAAMVTTQRVQTLHADHSYCMGAEEVTPFAEGLTQEGGDADPQGGEHCQQGDIHRLHCAHLDEEERKELDCHPCTVSMSAVCIAATTLLILLYQYY